ncbi:MAG: hypothetical protein NZ602_09530 [Thermoguttaceae bacterium]|nr:hypothetical protein [Thermoguttaceae bacterium]MDW8039060.1 hypothetical protein [Thermoguttaceae bacterium]
MAVGVANGAPEELPICVCGSCLGAAGISIGVGWEKMAVEATLAG